MLQQDKENDPTIKDQMANLGCLLVHTFGNFFTSVSVAAHIVNNLDLSHEQQSFVVSSVQHKQSDWTDGQFYADPLGRYHGKIIYN